MAHFSLLNCEEMNEVTILMKTRLTIQSKNANQEWERHECLMFLYIWPLF